jgi:hypothetical protein
MSHVLDIYDFKAQFDKFSKCVKVFASFSAEFDFMVRRCFAFDESNTYIRLVAGENGCRVNNLLSNFVYRSDEGTVELIIGEIYSVFNRFRQAKFAYNITSLV